MRLPPGVSGEVSFTLRLAQEPGIRIPLRPTTPPSYVNNEYCSLVLEVPTGTAPGLYDLEVRSPAASYYSRRSVKVIDSFKTRFRFVHLSNMNVGDLTAPDFDELLPQEINLLAPEFIIATGDYTEWARARDDASSWIRVLKFFEAFHAPVFMLCGLHDHEASFSDVVASKPIGTIDYGGYHGLLLLDHPGNPIDQDYDQLEWIETDLRRNRDKRFNFIAANSDELALLDVWRERGDVAEFVKKHKIKMFIVGGSTDWDYREFAQKLAGLDDLHFIRTHQASTSMRDRATGFSHYRVIEVDGDQITYIYPNDNARENLAHSIPTGRLRAFYDAPNDGSSQRVGVTVQNALNQGFKNVHLWLRVAKGPGGGPPKIAPGRVARVLDAGHYWACDVVVDLPDKGGLRVVASTNPADLPPARPITVELGGPRDWTFEPRTTNFGLSYFTCQAPASLTLTNHTDEDQTCWPVIRINGTQLHPDRTVCPRLPLTIKSGTSVSVPLVLNLRRVSPGRHAMQVYFLEDPLCRLTTFDVDLSHRQQAAGDADRLP
jgi:predicted MPP superfamily phosphohydrolase